MKKILEEQFCTDEISLKLKELGFNKPCLAYYVTEDYSLSGHIIEKKGTFVQKGYYVGYGNYEALKYSGTDSALRHNAPLWQQAIDWLNSEHKLYIAFYPPLSKGGFMLWDIYVIELDSDKAHKISDIFPNKEIAILKAIEIIKSKIKEKE